MAFTGRFGIHQSFMPGATMGVTMVPVISAAQYMLPTGIPTVISGGPRAFASKRPTPIEKPPQTTCFVGNIHERCSNDLIRAMLQECGNVISWKRIQGSNGKYQAFGFCEFDHPESTMRALRILHDWRLGDKRLVVKVDEKTRELLRGFVDKKRQMQGKSPLKLEKDELPCDALTKKDDLRYKQAIETLIRQEAADLISIEDGEITSRSPTLHGKGGNLDIDNMDREKKEYIRDEINRFRESHKEDEKVPEKRPSHRSDRSATFRDHRPSSVASSSPGRPASTHRPGSRRSRSRTHETGPPTRTASKRPRSPSVSSHERRRSRSSSAPSVSSSRASSAKQPRRRRKSRSRSRSSSRNHYSEDEEETLERKQLERRIRAKELNYQERLRKWEKRERKQAKEYLREGEEKKKNRKEEQREAKKLKEFLEDYDDERDDPKYYKSSSFFQRKREYEKEREMDARDRQKEKEEIDDLRRQILQEGFSGNPEAEAIRRHHEHEEQLLRKVRADSDSPSPHRRLGSKPEGQVIEGQEEWSDDGETSDDGEGEGKKQKQLENHDSQPALPVPMEMSITTTTQSVPQKPLGFGSMKFGTTSGTNLSLVFGEDVDADQSDLAIMQRKVKRPFKPLELTEEEKIETMTPEEKKRLIKNLIEKIPTAKEELFAYPIDWTNVDETLVERRVKPWVNKKIVEYIGEEEVSLVDFICQKVSTKTTAAVLLEDIAMVLDDEAEVFVVKMWRLLIYESEAKKLGLVKTD